VNPNHQSFQGGRQAAEDHSRDHGHTGAKPKHETKSSGGAVTVANVMAASRTSSFIAALREYEAG